MRKPSLLSATLILAFLTQACGLRGPLYLPEPAKPVEPVAAGSDAKAPDAESSDSEREKKKKTESEAKPTIDANPTAANPTPAR